jgi:Flp pilus assembly pilin Flp
MLRHVMQRPRVRRVVGLFLRNATGVSAVEFALVLPVMLVILVGMAELSHAIDNYRKVTLLARTISDLTSQGDTTNPIANATMTDILASSKVVLAPLQHVGPDGRRERAGCLPEHLEPQAVCLFQHRQQRNGPQHRGCCEPDRSGSLPDHRNALHPD